MAIWQLTYLSVATRRFYFASETASIAPRLYSVATAFLVLALNAMFISSIQTLGTAIALQRI